MKQKLSVSFSGGRTSAYMAKWLIDNKSDEYEFSFIFANTGLEHEKTLDFVNECDKRWGLNLVWLEAVVHHNERKGCTHKIVTYETASRKGEPFKAVCSKYGMPSPTANLCTRELKINVINSYERAQGVRGSAIRAIGIRIDEIDRINPKFEALKLIYPLVSMNPKTKEQIRYWWSEQEFDLQVPEHLGNCVTCFKKSTRKLLTIAKSEPSRFDVFIEIENLYSETGASKRETKFFRGNKDCSDILADSKQPFVEFVDYMPELQLGLLDELDESNGCSESCEIYAD